MRFVVTRLEGDLMPRVSGKTRTRSASFHVIDTAVNHRLVATYRTEQHTNLRSARAHVLAEQRANEHAARLNG